MALITVEGIPDNIGKGKLSTILKSSAFKDMDIDFWIQKFKGNMYKKADIKFKTVEDAEKAKQLLHGFKLLYNESTYHLTCYKLLVTPVYEYQADKPNGKSIENQSTNQVFFSRDRSRSPISNLSNVDEIGKVDREIELMRKKRILVEEERKLLLEKKKLQILKNLKTSDINELRLFESVSDVASPTEIESVLCPKIDDSTAKTTPGFLRISRVIYSHMKEVIKRHITQENSFKLRKLVNKAIKERLAVIVEGKSYVKFQSIMAEYRLNYPISTDEILLKELSHKIKQTDSHATANELQPLETTNDGQAESGVEDENKAKKNSEVPPELNEDVDMENDCDDWSDDEPAEKPDVHLRPDSKQEDHYTIERIDLTDNISVTNEYQISQEGDITNLTQDSQDSIEESAYLPENITIINENDVSQKEDREATA